MASYLNCSSTSVHNHSLGTALSDQVLSLSQASQSDRVVGSSPIPLTFQIPNANINMLHRMYMILTPSRRLDVPGVSYGANVRCRPKTARTGVLKSVNTMKTEKICSVLPVMYMPDTVLVISCKTDSDIEVQRTKSIHGQLLGWGNGDFPRLLHLQCVHLLRCWWLPCGLGGLCALLACEGSRVAWRVGKSCILWFRSGCRVEVEHPLWGRWRKLGHVGLSLNECAVGCSAAEISA